MIHYRITVRKYQAQVLAEWDVAVDMSDPEVISAFTLTLGGAPLFTPGCRGQKAVKGADIATISNPTEDCPVCFVVSTNRPDSRDGAEVLLGENAFDEVNFSG